MASIPRMNRAEVAAARPRLAEIPGIVPSLKKAPVGCTFAPRCPHATAECRAEYPPLAERAPGHLVSCWHADRLPEAGHA
jgi:peptide/nickel transport system ATP-binding protein